ncbi:16S rRNA (cytosine(1402)-N(4))-methyltransferase RsmH [Candidatus Collierbacteria bacterium]|nr:16S rRNA (cytosine(1402)-N(4))-methyltransferase RsmH [Candidatus Collierbacteria bacterium]
MKRHQPVFADSFISFLNLKPDHWFYDLTLGDGGHTEKALDTGCRVVSFDIDPDSIARAIDFLKGKYQPLLLNPSLAPSLPQDARWIIIKENFARAGGLISDLKLPLADALLADLGTSQSQILNESKGLSFQLDAPLDMRLDPALSVTAKDLLNALSEKELDKLLNLGDEEKARSIAKAIVSFRKSQPLTTTGQLADLVARVKTKTYSKIHPATKTFMALRMAVNLERENLTEMLESLGKILKPGAIAGVISFHSAEDRLVKNYFRAFNKEGSFRVITEKPIKPSKDEISINPKIRSAKLRLAQKV